MIDFNPNTNYRELIEKFVGKDKMEKVIRHYEYVNRRMKSFGSQGINPIFSAYLQVSGFTPMYANATTTNKFFDYTMKKLAKFYEANKFRQVKVGKETYYYSDIFEEYKLTKNYVEFKRMLKLLQENDPSYTHRKQYYYNKD